MDDQNNVTFLPPVYDSPETAYIIDDYPTGRRARCVKRVWIETKPKHGQRVVYQTSQPKHKMEAQGWKEGDPVPEKWWRARKASTYSNAIILCLDENNHLKHKHFNFIFNGDPGYWQGVLEKYGEYMNSFAKESISAWIELRKVYIKAQEAKKAKQEAIAA